MVFILPARKPNQGLVQGLPMVVFKTIVMLNLFSRYKTVGVEVWRVRL